MKEDQDIEELFRTSFEEFEVTPPAAVKSAVDREIGLAKRRWIWWMPLVGLALLATSVWWFMNADTAKKRPQERMLQQSDGSVSATSDHAKPAPVTGGEKKEPTAVRTAATPSATTRETAAGSDGKRATQQASGQPVSPNKSTAATAQRSYAKRKQRKTTGALPNGAHSAGEYAVTPNDYLQTTDRSPKTQYGGRFLTGLLTLQAEWTQRGATTHAETTGTEIATVTTDSGPTDQPDDKKKTDPNWRAAVFAGPQFPINRGSDDPARQLSEKTGILLSAEINRTLYKGFGLTFGCGYQAAGETLTATNFELDTVGMYTDSIPEYGNPNFPDSITGYIYFTAIDTDTTVTQAVQTNRVSTIAFPLLVTRHFSFGDHWGLLVNAGAVFRLHTFRLEKENTFPTPLPSRFTVSPMARIHVTYALNNWMFSVGVNTGFDVKNPLNYEGFDRKRYYLTPQFGVHFSF